MTDEAGESFVMPPLSQRQREALIQFLEGKYLVENKYALFHGTLRRNLLEKGLVSVRPELTSWVELTNFGRQVAEQVQEEEISRAGARISVEAAQLLRQADADMRTPPPARPGYKPKPVDSKTLAATGARQREVEEVMRWLRDPARNDRIQHLRLHHSGCRDCQELDEMRRALELALINLAGEIDLLQQRLSFRDEDLERIRRSYQIMLESQRHLLQAIASSVGLDIPTRDGLRPTEET